MATQTIFDELICSGIELNMLETRENIIRHFAHHCIIREAKWIIGLLLESCLKQCYQELNNSVIVILILITLLIFRLFLL